MADVLLLERIHPIAAELLSAAGHNVSTMDRALSPDELSDRLGGVQLLGIRSQTTVTADVLEQNDDLQAIGAFCIGTNQIDLKTAAHRGIVAFNAPFSNTRSVVELAIGEIIALTRRLTDKNAGLHAGQWNKSAAGAHEIRGRRLGIVGYGNIGSQLSVIAEALGLSVAFYDTGDKLALGNARRCDTMAELLASVDIVTLHVDGRSTNVDLFGEEQFAQMQPGSLFLNLSRGFTVDHDALRAHIESGHVAGAAIDVFPTEPKGADDPFLSELRGLPNVILTPHIGGSTEEAQEDIGRYVAGKLIDFAATGASAMSVNLPALAPDRSTSACRLVHVHHNVPGVLAAVNAVLAQHGVNIDSQQLATRDDVGYLITDISANCIDAARAELAALPETIRLRVITGG
jgi:D-3-phosphoglycerate dehydrogenase